MSEQLKNFVERIECLEETKTMANDDIKAVYAEAKTKSFDTKSLKAVVRRRKIEREALASLDATVATYEEALNS